MLAPVTVGVVQALEAGARANVAGARVVHVDVVVALAGHAAAAGHQGVPEVSGGALVAPGAWSKRGEETMYEGLHANYRELMVR